MNCCGKKTKEKKRGFLTGILYGLAPHSFCIAFVVFTVLGTAAATAFLKPFLMSRYFFHILIGLSFVFVTISAIIYLKKNGILSFPGIKRKKGYLLTLYGTTIGINLLLFMVIFPTMTNIDSETGVITALLSTFQKSENAEARRGSGFLNIKVDIPCSGHASLISGELKEIGGVKNVRYRFPNFFDVDYDSEETNQEEILSLEVFDVYRAEVVF